MLVPDSELPGSSHSYNLNPRLLSDYYSATPSIWNPDENGYYKDNKRIIAVYTEIRYKREHPSCYIPDSSTVTNMSSEAPVFHRILGTNVLPNWSDRFGRNITPSSSRALRDLQDDAFQGHWHILRNVHGEPFATNIHTSGSSYREITENGTVLGYHGYIHWAERIMTDHFSGAPRIANETRPKNFSLMYQIVRLIFLV